VLHKLFTAEFWEVLLGCWSVLSTLAAYRAKRWLSEHLEAERQRESERTAREFERHNETLRILSQASVSTERPTLDSLLADEKQDFRLESSETPSAPLDWSDDDEPTVPGTPQALQSEIDMAKKTKPKPVKRPKGY
jgi:hypothetical protein